MDKYQTFWLEKYEYFRSVLEQCSTSLLSETDDSLETLLFEELEIDIPCCLCQENLNAFFDRFMIDQEILDNCMLLREAFLQLSRESARTAEAVRRSEEWRSVFARSEMICGMLYYECDA